MNNLNASQIAAVLADEWTPSPPGMAANAKTHRPMPLHTGMATMDISELATILAQVWGTRPVTNGLYPDPPADLSEIPAMIERLWLERCIVH